MAPVLFHAGPLTLYSYGLMMALAFGLTTYLAVRASRRLPATVRVLAPDPVIDATCAALFGGIVGGRIFYVILHLGEFARSPLDVFAIWRGGLVWYGGFLGGLAGGWWYARLRRLPFVPVLDQMSPFVALGHGVGRVGCFLNGCCYGATSQAWCAVQFPGLPEPVLPTQLFEAAGLLMLYVVLRSRLGPWLPIRGRLSGAYCLGYGLLRFGLEFLRGDQTPFFLGLTLQQLISIGMIAAGGWFLMLSPAPVRTKR